MQARLNLNLQVTQVFQRNWNAIHARTPDGKQRLYRYIINTGSSRSSKTYSLIDCMDLYARQQVNKRLTVWRDTKTDCKKTVLNDALRHFKTTGRYDDNLFNKTESIFNYPTGSTFEIHGTDDENTVHGLTQNAAWLNEPYKISRDIFDQIDQRTSDFIFIDWNPKKAHWIEDIAKDPRALVIHSDFRDNPFCPPEMRTKILGYQPVSMCAIVTRGDLSEKEAKEYDMAANIRNFTGKDLIELARCRDNEAKNSASAYNWSVYGLGVKSEKPNRIYQWQQIPLDIYLAIDAPVYYYSDWGAVDPWAVGELKYYDGAIYVRERNYESENEIRMRLSPTERMQVGADDEGLVSWRFNQMGIDRTRVIVCDNNRPGKVLALRNAGYDYAVAPAKKSGSIVDGIDLLSNLKVYYTSDSPNIQYEQENYSRLVDRFGVVQEEPEDVDNHHMDGIRITAIFLQSEGIIRKV